MLLLWWSSAGYVPQRTAYRDKLFFGIDSPPVVATGSAPARLPPANSQISVNLTASQYTDLNDYGSAGVPEAVRATRKIVQDESGATPTFLFFEVSPQTSGLLTLKHALDCLSVLWLVLLIAGCYYFLKVALAEGNKPVGVLKTVLPTTVAKKKENTQIDREAYVYVDGG